MSTKYKVSRIVPSKTMAPGGDSESLPTRLRRGASGHDEASRAAHEWVSLKILVGDITPSDEDFDVLLEEVDERGVGTGRLFRVTGTLEFSYEIEIDDVVPLRMDHGPTGEPNESTKT